MEDCKLKFDFMTDNSVPKFETREVTLLEALNNSLTLFSIEMDLHCSSKVIKENFRRVRKFVMDYVIKRKPGKVKSEVHNVDMLSLFLKSPDIFTDIFILKYGLTFSLQAR